MIEEFEDIRDEAPAGPFILWTVVGVSILLVASIFVASITLGLRVVAH